MRVRGMLRLVCRGDSEGDEPLLGLLPQAVEQIGSMVVLANARSVEDDRTLVATAPATHRGEGAAVADGSRGELVLDSAVSEAIKAVGGHVPDLLADVVSTGHDDVGAQIPNQLFVGTRRVGDDAEPVRLRELHDVAAVASYGARDGHGLSRRRFS